MMNSCVRGPREKKRRIQKDEDDNYDSIDKVASLDNAFNNNNAFLRGIGDITQRTIEGETARDLMMMNEFEEGVNASHQLITQKQI